MTLKCTTSKDYDIIVTEQKGHNNYTYDNLREIIQAHFQAPLGAGRLIPIGQHQYGRCIWNTKKKKT